MHYYLMNNEVKKGDKMPKNGFDYTNWFYSLQPCSITENELTNIVRHLSIYDNENYNTGNPIEVTDITDAEYDGHYENIIITFKDPIIESPTKVEETNDAELWDDVQAFISQTYDVDNIMKNLKEHFTLTRKK